MADTKVKLEPGSRKDEDATECIYTISHVDEEYKSPSENRQYGKHIRMVRTTNTTDYYEKGILKTTTKEEHIFEPYNK